jgi:L-ascorbate metabolism protein UlaG (beta-lactamase superfamily)
MNQMRTYPVRITHIGGPTALIEIGQLRLLTDPTFDPAGSRYVNGPVELIKKTDPALTVSELGEVDAVLLSHDQHIDNLDLAGRAYLPQAKQVLTTLAGARRLDGGTRGIAPWETVDLHGTDGLHVHVTATPARHGPRELEEVLGEEVVRDVSGWIIEWDGQRRGAIYVSGDTVLFEELQEIPQRYQIGTALLHFGAAHFDVFGPVYLTFTAAEGARFAKALGEAIIIPIHYEGWTHFTEGRAEIEQAFAAAGLEQRLRFLPFGQPVSVDV